MTDGKKKRLSMLDNIAAASRPPGAAKPPAPSQVAPSQVTPPQVAPPQVAPPQVAPMTSTNRALRSARDAVDGHHVWDLDPYTIDDLRPRDRLDPDDVEDLRRAIEANGQTVPILVRRAPNAPERYLLVYGRRRLEAIRLSDKVTKVRALVAALDDRAALRAQISENMARRDLTFIEKALFAADLVESGFGTQNEVAEVLTITKSAISMSLAILSAVGADLARAIGPAPGIGRPRWDALGTAVEAAQIPQARLVEVAGHAHAQADIALVSSDAAPAQEPSVLAFEAVMRAVTDIPAAPRKASTKARKTRALTGAPGTTLRRSARGLSIEIQSGPFADWLEAEAETALQELHARWQSRAED
ncbi:MAG: plasmid partitioning protein RepB [Pseudomonadota bacterium]